MASFGEIEGREYSIKDDASNRTELEHSLMGQSMCQKKMKSPRSKTKLGEPKGLIMQNSSLKENKDMVED